MLVHLGVRDLAIVDNLDLDLGAGMTVLTGETGAGKSLLVDALELAVGERASADLVRAGAASAEVNAVFEPPAAARDWLREHSLDDDEDACVLRRVVSADGRSRAFVNGRPVPVAQLRALGEHLVDVHGQHAHQGLLDPRIQRELLDAYCGNAELLGEVASAHATLRALEHEIAALGAGGEDPRARIEYLDFQIAELRAQPLRAEEQDALEADHRRLANAVELIAAVARAGEQIDDEVGGAATAVSAAVRTLEQAARLDPALQAPRELLAQCVTLLDEAAMQLRRYGDRVEVDDGRLQSLERTLAALHDLARKHRCAPADLLSRAQALEREREALDTGAARAASARVEHERAMRAYRELARTLTQRRADGARAVGEAVNGILDSLGMHGATVRFDVRADADAAPGASGTDTVSLLASTNPGQEHMPLARVASGGELSRIALAVHAVALRERAAATVVFDEVDAGIGGAVAEIVGRRMRALGEHRQVLAVTHLAQVAALAHGHVVVRKLAGAGTGNRTAAEAVAGPAREQEIARMLGGVRITGKTLDHAREMLAAGAREDGGA